MSSSQRDADLVSLLLAPDPGAACDAARELGSRRAYGAVPALLDVLGATSDPGLRDAAALALSDMRVQEAFDLIVDLLQQERTRGCRGTLLYALEPYDCAPILPLLVDLVVEDTYESAREAASRIIETASTLNDETWDQLRSRLRTAYEVADPSYAVKDPERREQVIASLLELFEEEVKPGPTTAVDRPYRKDVC